MSSAMRGFGLSSWTPSSRPGTRQGQGGQLRGDDLLERRVIISPHALSAETVTPQVFTLLNSDVMSDRAIALALRAEKEFDTLHLQVKRAVQLAYGRVWDKVEWERFKQYVTKMRAYHAKHEPPAVVYPTAITRSLVEELTGQPFEYEEILPVFEDYIRDRKPADVSANTRALADLCLLLFNSNEFMYVY